MRHKKANGNAKHRPPSGPEPERLKVHGDWKAAVKKALRKPKPPGGWPN